MVEAPRQQQPQAQSVVVSIHDNDEHLFLVLPAEQLQRISHGELPLSPSIERGMLVYFAAQAKPNADLIPHIKLTEPESGVLLRVAKGFPLRGIGVQLHLSRHTIADYVKQIYRKLNVSSHVEAALEAQRLGLFNRANSMSTSYSGLANWQR